MFDEAYDVKFSFEYYRPNPFASHGRKGKPKIDKLVPTNLFGKVCSNILFKETPKFQPNGGAVCCKILGSGSTISEGWAFCSYSDNFSRKEGRKLAFERARRSLYERVEKFQVNIMKTIDFLGSDYIEEETKKE